MRAIGWRIIPLLFLGMFLANVDKINLGFAALTMNQDLGLGQAAFGFAASIFFLAYALFEVPSNLVLARVGARRWLPLLVVVWGVVSGLTALVSTAPQLYAIRFLLGVAEAGFAPGVLFYLTLWVPRAYRAQMFAVFLAAQPLGVLLGGPLSVPLLALDGYLALRGWQWLFILQALPPIVLGIIMYFVLPSYPRDARWLRADQQAWLDQALANEQNAIHGVGSATMGAAFRNPRLILFSIALFGMAGCWWCVVFFLPQIVQSLGPPAHTAVLLSSTPYVLGTVLSLVTGRIADRSERIELWLAGLALVVAFGLLFMALLDMSVWALVGTAIAATGVICLLPMALAAVPRLVSAPAVAASIGGVTMLANIGAFVGPPVFGSAADETGGYGASILIFAGVAAFSSLMYFVSALIAARSTPLRSTPCVAELAGAE